MAVPNSQVQQIRVYSTTITNSEVVVEIMSDQAYQNTVSSVTITVLLIKKSSSDFFAYESSFDAWCPSCSQNTSIISSSISPSAIEAELCIPKLEYIETYTISSANTKELTRSFSGNKVLFVTQRLYTANFDFLCYLSCAGGSYYDASASPIKCTTCPNDCTTCANASYCNSCSDGYLLDQGQCHTCNQSSGKYMSNG